MTDRVFLHVGPFKTGSTFLQQVLDRNRDVLAERGMSLPGGSTKAQAMAAMDLVGAPTGGGTRPVGWDQVAEQARTASAPDAVISAEHLCRAKPRQVRHAVTSLQPAEVHVVYMARDLAKVIPAMWQTLMRNGGSVSWDDFLASVRTPDEDSAGHGHRFWQNHDPRKVLARWETQVPRERIHVVTVPPSGGDPAVLWRRFCTVLGLSPDGCSLEVRRSNESLGSVEAGLLQRLNAQLGGVRQPTYNRWVKRFIARSILEQRKDQRRFALPEEEHTWLRPRIEEIREFLAGQGYPLIGDLDDLLPRSADAVPAPGGAEAEEMLDVALEVIAGLVRAMDRPAGSDRRQAAAPRQDSLAQTLTDRFSRVAHAGAARRRRIGRPARWRNRR
jgi:hypothetical protein